MAAQSSFLKVTEVCALMNLTPSRVYQLLARGEIPATKIGGVYRVPRNAWDSWIDQKTSEALARGRKSS